MGMQQKVGIGAVIFGVLLLVIGLVFSGMIIDGVNKQGGKIGCYDSDDNQIKSATGPAVTAAGTAIDTTSSAGKAVPSKVSKSYQGPTVVDQVCGNGSVTVASGVVTSADTLGTIRYTLEVYGADSLNNLFTMIYWVILIGLSLGGVGGGGLLLARGARGM